MPIVMVIALGRAPMTLGSCRCQDIVSTYVLGLLMKNADGSVRWKNITESKNPSHPCSLAGQNKCSSTKFMDDVGFSMGPGRLYHFLNGVESGRYLHRPHLDKITNGLAGFIKNE